MSNAGTAEDGAGEATSNGSSEYDANSDSTASSRPASKGKSGSSSGGKAAEGSKTAKRVVNVPQFFLTLKGDVSTIRTDLDWKTRLQH